MPYFSFSLDQSFLDKIYYNELNKFKIVPKNKYYSKNTKLWKILSKNNKKITGCFLQFENREKITILQNKILFCLPPNIGLGDAIEYALAIKSIIETNRFTKVGVAYVGIYSKVFSSYFQIKCIYPEIISSLELETYETIFRFSLEINSIHNQKYSRSDIESNINKYFHSKPYRNFPTNKIKKTNKISIFPISTSPIRSMPIKILQNIIDKLSIHYKIQIILDRESPISNFIEKNIKFENSTVLFPENFEKLIKIIKKIQFGLFMDSGPLHVAKILNKPGILIETSVSNKILLNNFKSIKALNISYKSDYCKAPCGLTNIFNYNNNSGCYDSLKINNKKIENLNKNSMQRGLLKDKYIHYMINPVSCVDNINIDSLIKMIKTNILK